MILRALTIKQPWASLLVAGIKTVENRSWTTAHRGPLAIHAGAARERNAAQMIVDCLGRDLTASERVRWLLDADLPQGQVLGVVELIDVVPVEQTHEGESPWAIGPWCWRVRPGWQFQPHARPTLAGKLGLWKWDSGDLRIGKWRE